MSDDRTSHDPEHDDPTAARLRAALNAEAAMVHPDDQLSSIRERTEGAARPWWQRPAVAAVAAAVVLGLAVGGGVALLGGDEPPVVAGGKGSTSASPTESSTPSETPSASEGSATPTSASPTDDVWVYYVGDQPDLGPRLYREQRQGGGADPAEDAVGWAIAQSAQDPDYTSPWPEGTALLSYSVSGDTATVDLSRFVEVGAQLEQVAVQQIVYTVTANDRSVTRVRLLVDGQTPSSGHEDWSAPVPRSPRLDVQALIWLLTPGEGATVSSPVQIAGYGTAFEATINWEVRRAGSDDVVAEGFTNGGANGEFADFSDSVDLEPGTYEMRALEFSAEDGRPLNVDTKAFTVE